MTKTHRDQNRQEPSQADDNQSAKTTRSERLIMRDREFEDLHAATLQVLEEVGLHLPDVEVLGALEKVGLRVERDRQSVKFSRRQVAEAIYQAPKEVRLYHGPSEQYVALSGQTRFMPSGTGVAVLDPGSGKRRDSRAADVRDLVKIQDGLKHLDVARPLVTALEFGADSDLVECYLCLRHTNKPFMHRTMSEKNAQVLIRMGVRVTGSAAELRRRPPFAVVYCPKSPLTLTPEAARCMLAFAAAGVPVLVLSMAMGGATSPVTLQGQALLINAEVLAGITIIQTLFPGAPVLYGSVASVLDMRTAVLALGAPERGLLNGLCAELARRYGLPSVMGGLSTDAKEPDEQAGFEKALTLWPLMGKASLVFGLGVMDSANTYSYEQLVLDDEMIGAVKRVHQGLDQSQLAEEISLIKQVGWSGEYLTSDHTLKHFRRHWLPELMTRAAYEKWAEAGKSLTARTRERIAKILQERPPSVLDQAMDRDLRNLLLEHGITLPDDV
ncbi:MAG: trimethylamine methyltransferase family protein [Thermodesulfobacteriota bacterium]